MSNAPIYNLDMNHFWLDPYPDLKVMRNKTPIAYVPQLDATLITKRQAIFENEKKTTIFASDQPNSLMTHLMGQNMMRKDGAAHLAERRAIFPAVSPKTTKLIWKQKFLEFSDTILDELEVQTGGDLVSEYAMPLSAKALKAITGLTNMDTKEMNRVSQGMIDGIANYEGNEKIEKNCHNCTASIDAHIDEILNYISKHPDNSLLSVQIQAGLSDEQIRANIKLAISGGQNESRDAIAGTIWALLRYSDQMKSILANGSNWLKAVEEFLRWISPIGMSPRRITKDFNLGEVTLFKDDKVFFMFGSGNRDEECFKHPEEFNISQDRANSIFFGAGPHFCAGAAISKCLIGEVAIPKLFSRFPNLRLDERSAVLFHGWAFRGPVKVQCLW